MPASDFDFPQWQKQFISLIRDSRNIQASWDRLTKAGCDSESLMWGFALSCDFKDAPGYEILKELRFQARQQAGRAVRIARRLELDRKEAVDLLGSETPPGLEDGLKAAILRLREDAKTVRRSTSVRHLKPALALMFLVGYIEERTGTPHYRDVSCLLDTAYTAFRVEFSVDTQGEEAIRKAIGRFKRDNPSLVGPNGKFQVRDLLVRLGLITAIVLTMVQHFTTPRE